MGGDNQIAVQGAQDSIIERAVAPYDAELGTDLILLRELSKMPRSRQHLLFVGFALLSDDCCHGRSSCIGRVAIQRRPRDAINSDKMRLVPLRQHSCLTANLVPLRRCIKEYSELSPTRSPWFPPLTQND